MAERESPFTAAVEAIRPLLLGGTIRDAERIALAALRAATAAADDEPAELHPVFGLRIDYTSTLREERPAGDNLADAQTARDRIAARPDVVSCTVIGWLADEWHEIGDDRG